jgi:DNA-3-methyladenine glycosylase I
MDDVAERTTKPGESLVIGEDGKARCFWCASAKDYRDYHDHEWGRPVHDDRRLFEKICLEGFQSGLSWLTILRKRDNFRRAFADFDYHKVSKFGEKEVERLLQNAGLVRHRKKIESTVNNAARAVELEREFGSLSEFFWQFVPPRSERPEELTRESLRTLSRTPTSQRLSTELKKRGWSFIGPTTAYAFMQAMGLVNDHMAGCDFSPAELRS